MANWVLIPCLKALFAEFDAIGPDRDKKSDGTIGDVAHQKEVSDHNPDETGSVPIHDADKVNEVHAIDVDSDLGPGAPTMEQAVQFLLSRCRSGKEKRLRYIIYTRRIWSASSGWVQKAYTGSSAHVEHAHFSGSYVSSLEASTASWHLEDIPVALTDNDKAWIAAQNAKMKADILAEVLGLNDKIKGAAGHPDRTFQQYLGDQSNLRGFLVGDKLDAPNSGVTSSSPLGRIVQAADRILSESE